MEKSVFDRYGAHHHFAPVSQTTLKKIMRFSLFVFLSMLITTQWISASSLNGQNLEAVKVSLSLSNETLVHAFQKIEKQTSFRFMYRKEDVRHVRSVSHSGAPVSLDQLLSAILTPNGLTYRQVGQRIMIMPGTTAQEAKPPVFPDIPVIQPPLKGRVTDEKGEGLPGVSILLKGTQQGTTTDGEGNFTLNVPDENALLVFSFVGYVSQEVVVGSRTLIEIQMVSDTKALDELVITGYTAQRKKDIVGSVSVVDMDKLNRTTPGSAQESLQGMVSGMNVINSGIPGTPSKIFIRGVTSFGNTDPLVLVDGIQQNLNNINVNDIESIQVLKDAGAAAIYGVRGANGVIVVTTKKGKIGKPVISYEGFYGIQNPLPGNPYNVLNSQDWMKVMNTAFPGNDLFKNGMPDYTYRGPKGAGAVMTGDPAADPSLYYYEPRNTGRNYIIQEVNKTGEDWFHNIFKKAPRISHSLTASGGTEKSKYLFNLSYLNHKGTMIEAFEKRYSVRINTEFNIGKNVRVGENANIIQRNVPNVNTGMMTAAYRMSPVVPLRDIKGNWAGTFGGPDLGVIGQPVAVQTRNTEKDINSTWNIIGNAYAEVDILKDIVARTSIGYNIANTYTQDFTATETENIEKSTQDNMLSVGSSFGKTMTWTNTLGYNRIFDRHKINILLGTEAIKSDSRGVTGGSARFFSEDLNYLVVNNGTMNITANSSISASSLFSIFGRLDYAFNDRYLLGFTLRRDGSSAFGPNKRYGVFPSLSLGWRVSEEGFMENLTWLNDFKLKGSYGVLGSQNNVSGDNSFSLYRSSLSNTYYDITGSSTSIVQGFAQSRIGNLNTGWEENIVSNFGFDATVFNNKLSASLEYYKKSIKGLLFSQPLPAVILGDATAPTINIGDIQNSGIDASIRYHDNIARDLDFSVGLNFTSYRNKVVHIPDPGYFYSASQYAIGNIARNEVGHPVSSFYGYKIIGLFNSQSEIAEAPTQSGAAPGRFRYQDTDGNGVINADDQVHLGNPNPDFTYGLTLGLTYKGFDFTGIFYGSQGNELYNSLKAYTHFMSSYKEQKSNDLLNAWTPENMNTTIPKVEATPSFSTTQVSNSFYVEDGSYLRLKSLILGYNLGPGLLQKLRLSNLRVYAQASNLFTLTKYSGLDPELAGSSASFGIDYGGYPNNETSFVFGVNLSF